jgi:hypothetical protein
MTAPVRPPGRETLHCTCALGKCSRNGHSPLSAQCGHPGIYAQVPIPGEGYQGSHRSVCHRDACRLVAEKLVRPFRSQEAIGRAIGELTGVAGRKGGWIYDAAGRPIVQGWAGYAHRMAGEVRGGVSRFDYVAGQGHIITEAGLRRLAANLARIETGDST